MSVSIGVQLPVPSGYGSIEQYIRTVNSIPLLSEKEEHELAKRYSLFEDLEAAKKLILSHLRVVVSVARSYDGYGLNQGDLIQEGSIGLMKAVRKFDPERGVRLFSFAIHWIKAEIHEFILKNWRMVKIATTKPQRKLFFNLRSMKKNLNSLTITEAKNIAGDLGVKVEEVLEMEQRMTGHDINLIRDTDNEDSYAPIDWLTDSTNDPEVKLENKANYLLETDGLQKAIDQLDERSKDIVRSRWLSNEKNLTLHDLAKKYNISAERVRQIEVKAMEKMKVVLSLQKN